MELYTILRHFADSWALLALVLFFVGVIVWVNRPGGRRGYQAAATSIFRNDDRPAAEAAPAATKETAK
jgi:cytochrome c oxidase cbb3-type subunit 4